MVPFRDSLLPSSHKKVMFSARRGRGVAKEPVNRQMSPGRLAPRPLNEMLCKDIKPSFIVMLDVLISFIFAQAPLVAPEDARAFPTAFAGISAYMERTKIVLTGAIANALYKIKSVKSRAFFLKTGRSLPEELKMTQRGGNEQ